MSVTPNKPRILFVDHTSKLGGAEFVLLGIAAGFAGDSTVLLFEDGPLRTRLQEAGVPTQLVRGRAGLDAIKRDRSLLRALPALATLAGIVRQTAAAARTHDVVYANSQKSFVVAAIAAFIARRPLVWHLHDILVRAHFGAAQIRLGVTLANRFAARVVVPSAAAAAAFVSAGGRASLVRVIPNGVDLVPLPATRAQLRTQLGLPEGFLFGVFSRLAPWKGQSVALESLAALPGAHALIAGDALFGEQAYAASLRQTAARLGITARVHFLGHRDDVPALMQAVDVVVHPSLDPEPFGRTLVEAMLCRTPVIATTGGAAAEILGASGEAGLLIPPNDPAALTAALLRLRDDADLAARLVTAGNARARALFGGAGVQRGVASLLAELAPHPASPAASTFVAEGDGRD